MNGHVGGRFIHVALQLTDVPLFWPYGIVVLGGASDGSVTRKFWEIFYWTRLFFQFHGESNSRYAL